MFGTRVTMQGRFYQHVFEPSGVAIVLPGEEEQAYVHDKYMTGLLKGILRPEPLILRDPTASGILLLDTTVIHARAIVAMAMRL